MGLSPFFLAFSGGLIVKCSSIGQRDRHFTTTREQCVVQAKHPGQFDFSATSCGSDTPLNHGHCTFISGNEMVAISSSNLDDTGYWRSSDSNTHSEGNHPENSAERVIQPFGQTSKNRAPMATTTDESRFILWVDAVGGFLVCPRQEVTLGQAVEQSQVDIPVLGDLARRHLKIKRTSEGYLLEAFGYVRVNGDECRPQSADLAAESGDDSAESSRKVLLKDGDILELTGGIKIRFSKPHPLSASARLDFESPHRTQPWSDAVLLMAESCVFGPNLRNHVVCRQWSEDLVFFQQQGRLFCKSLKPITVDGVLVDGKQELSRNSHIEGEDFSMTIEPLLS